MASKAVTDRQKSARAVTAAAHTHANEVATHVAELLSPHLRPDEEMPDVSLFLRLVGRLIATENEALVRADAAHERELADDAAPRKARDEAVEKVRRILVDLRAAVETTCGMAGLPRLHLLEAVPTDPSVLATIGRSVLDALRDESVRLPAPRRRGLSLDREAFAEELELELPPLEKALAAVAREAREAEATLRQKRAAMEANDRAFSRGAAVLSSTFALAGLEDLAGRLKPSVRQPGETNEFELAATRAETGADG
ncbi:hypothetical protein [Polyangium sp. 15x6]|uniref:hypothetical protein n=1 Tax=Polyangium sp. 15x6 TaxID=3042687 RepID=UPI00249C4D27|nr:hypothetical protein [Polyangium sp. 15x6]MDI3282957.1 hypothetical protein [Polyangium sp. 15x6]